MAKVDLADLTCCKYEQIGFLELEF